jgi:acyl dehydratase
VRPGDTLRARYTVQEKRDLASRPDVGVSKVLVELSNQKNETVANWTTNQLSRRRQPGPAPASPGPKREHKAIPSVWDEPGTASPLRPDFFFDDRQIGELTDMGTHTFGKDEMIAFAREFDPQPFHLDEAAAKASLFGALCASGWHTAAYRASESTITLARRAPASQPMAPRRAFAISPGTSPRSSATLWSIAAASPRRSI